MQKNIDEYIQERGHKLWQLGDDEAEATLLLAQKVRDVERATRSVEETLIWIYNTLDSMLEKTDRPSN